MSMSVKEVKTLFTLDAKSLKEGMKDADKSVKALQKEFTKSQKEANKFIKELKDVKKELKNLDKDIEIDLNINDTIDDIDDLIRQMEQVKRETRNLKREADDCLKGLNPDKIDLTTFGRIETLLKNMGRIEVINTDSIDKAQSKVRDLVSSLDNMELDMNINANYTNAKSFAENNGLRHWIDNNASGVSSGADDTQQALNRLIDIASDIANNKNNLNVERVNIGNDEDIKRLSSDVSGISNNIKNMVDSYKDVNQQTLESVANSKAYEEQIQKLASTMMKFGKIAKENFDFEFTENLNSKELEQELNKVMRVLKQTSNSIQADSKNALSIANAYQQVSAELKQVEAMQLKVNKACDDYTEGVKEAQEALKNIQKSGWPDEMFDELLGQEEALKGIVKQNEKQLEVIRKTNKELDEQKVLLNQKERQLKDEYNALQKNTKETKEQTEAIEKQDKALKQTKEGFKDIGASLNGFGDVLGVDINGFTSKIMGIKQAGSSAYKGIKGLGEAAGMSGKALATLGVTAGAVAGTLAVFVGAVGSVVAGLKGVYEVFKATLPEFKEFESAIAKTSAALYGGTSAITSYRDTLKDAFTNQGYTDNIDEFSDAFLRVHQMLNSFDDVDLSKLTEDILTVAEITKWDVNEITRAIKNMATNMGIDVTKALDMVYSAWQQTGDPANDLLDTFNEYSSQFNKMGVSADWAFEKIVKGLQSGVYNSDKIADSFKELWLRIADPADIDESELKALGYTLEDIANGSDAVVEAFDKLGISTNRFKEEVSKGGESAENALDTLITKITQVQDKATQQSIIAALFGAPGEDMGTQFFDYLTEAEEDIANFNGAVEESATIIESTLSYQLGELNNKWSAFKASFLEESIAPIVKALVEEITQHFDTLKTMALEQLVPAFEKLFFALIQPFIPENRADIVSWGEVLITAFAGGIEFAAKFINACQVIIQVFVAIGNSLANVWQIAKSFFGFFITSLGMIGNVLNSVFMGGIAFVNEFLLSCKGGFKDVITFAQNMGIGIYNAVGGAFSKCQKAAATFVNGFIDMYNKSIGNIPGVGKLGHVKWGSNFKEKAYKDYGSGRKAWEGNQSWEAYKYADTQFEAMISNGQSMMQGAAGEFGQNITDSVNALNKALEYAKFDENYAEYASWIEKLRKAQDKENQAIEKKKQTQLEINQLKEEENKNTEKDKITGNDITKDELKKKQEALKEAQKQEQEAKKEAEEARKEAEKALKEQQEMLKKKIAWEKEYYDKKRGWQEQINNQQLALVEDNIQAMNLEIQMIQSLKDNYALTADQMISYTQKQFNLALKVRDAYASRVQDAIKKELEATKKKADKEYQIEHNKNNRLIRDKELQIKAIDALMRENEYGNTQEDLDYEIAQTEKEYQKYMFATSYEGIQKREELEERLRELRLEKERNAKRKELEDKKQSLEDEIDDIKYKDEQQREEAERQANKMQEIYDNMFTELEELFEGGTANIADIQKYAQQTNNQTIKGLLNEYVQNYKNAMDQVQKYMLSMNQIQGWYQNDLQTGATNGALTGDKDAVDKNDFISGLMGKEEATKKYNALKQEHSKLTAKKNKTDSDKARLKAIEKEVATLRKKYGFSGYQINGSHATGLDRVPFDNYVASVHKNEAILTAREADAWRLLKSQGLPDIRNVLNKQMAYVDSAKGQNIVNNHITNNNAPLLHIENFNNHSGADVRKIAYDINTNISIRNRSKGKM